MREREMRKREGEMRERDGEMRVTEGEMSDARDRDKREMRSNPEIESEEVVRLNKKVADTVKKRLNMYYIPLEDTLPQNKKISSEKEYTKFAKMFSHDLRSQIKETYIQYNRSVEGIKLTEDNKDHINNVIDMYFDRLPVVPFHR